MAKRGSQPLRLSVDVGAQATADRLADLVDERIHDAIVDLPTLRPPRHEARVQQQGEMSRHVGLTGAGRPHDLDDAPLPVPKRVQDAKTGRIGEESQPFRQRFEEFLR